MKRFSTTKVKNNFGSLLSQLIREEMIVITKYRKDIAVLITNHFFKQIVKSSLMGMNELDKLDEEKLKKNVG